MSGLKNLTRKSGKGNSKHKKYNVIYNNKEEKD